MFEVTIYGEIVPFQDSWIEENGFFNLSMLNKQLLAAEGKPLLVRINSYGGDVEEGFAIYQALRRYATENKVEIRTRCDGRCASIATVFFLAGDKRIVNEYISPFVHNAWCYAIGDAKEMMRTAVDLEATNQKIAEHYALHTDLTVEQARELMDANTAITPEECKKVRFATEIEKIDRPKALQIPLTKANKKSKNFKNSNNMSKAKAKSIFAKIEKLLGGNIQALEVYTDKNEVLDFYELGDGDVPKVGDKATYNDEPAEGSYMLADGKTQYTFTSGELTEIVEDSGDGGATDLEAANAEIDRLKAELADLKASNKSAVAAKDKQISTLQNTINTFKDLKAELEAAITEEEGESGKGAQSSNKKKNSKEKFTNFKIQR